MCEELKNKFDQTQFQWAEVNNHILQNIGILNARVDNLNSEVNNLTNNVKHVVGTLFEKYQQ